MTAVIAAICSLIFHLVISTDLSNSPYTSDFTFTLSNSPYFVNYNITFTSTANILIENGVNIIFNGPFTVEIYGNINAGCDDIDTLSIHTKGLADDTYNGYANTGYINIFGETTREGLISINNDMNTNTIKFCNTKFSNLAHGLSFLTTQYTPATIDNCLFTNLNYATFFSDATTNIMNFINDSIIIDVDNINYYGNVIYDNNKFDKYQEFCWYTAAPYTLGYCSNVIIRNNELSNSSNNCMTVYSCYEFYNNVISSCSGIGLVILPGIGNDKLSISHNTFTDILGQPAVWNYNDNIYIVNNYFMSNNIDIYLIGSTFYGNQYVDDIVIQNNIFEYTSNLVINTYNVGNNISIDSNKFANAMNLDTILYFGSMYNATYLYIQNNNFVGNLVQNNVIFLYYDYGGYVYIENNNFQNNTVSNGEFMNVGGWAFTDLYYRYNVFKFNSLSSSNYFIYHYMGDDIFFEYNYFENNDFVNSQGNLIYIQIYAAVVIRYNEFRTTDNTLINAYCNIDGQFSGNASITIQYNNFINYAKVYNIVFYQFVSNATENINNYNYFGTVVINEIQQKIYDGCDDSNSNKGLFTEFSPWFEQPIDLSDINNLPTSCIWNTNDFCVSTGTADCNNVSPTGSPIDLTNNPSIQPTNGPIKQQTNNPTESPSIQPTNEPTESPIPDPNASFMNQIRMNLFIITYVVTYTSL